MKGLLHDLIGIGVLVGLLATFYIGATNNSVQSVLTKISQENVTKIESLL
ncbi:MAG: hypothetical protein ACI4LO_02650 [Anaerovoracaceae bacterium]